MSSPQTAVDLHGPAIARAAGDSTCIVTVHGLGTTDITARVDDGTSSACALTVEPKPNEPDSPENPPDQIDTDIPFGTDEPNDRPNADKPTGPSDNEQDVPKEPGEMIIGPSYALGKVVEPAPTSATFASGEPIQTGDDARTICLTGSMALLSASIILFLAARRCFSYQGEHAKRTGSRGA